MNFWEQLKAGVFSELIGKFSAIIPKVIFASILLLIGWLLSNALRRVLGKVLASIGIDKLTEQLNDVEALQGMGLRIRFSTGIANIVYYVMMLFFIIMATDALGVGAITTMVRDLFNYLPAVLSAFIFLLLGLFLADMVRGAVESALRSFGLPSAKMIATGIFYFLFVTVAVSALAQAKINTNFIASNLTVIIGALALAFSFGYGLAARDLISNYLAGFYNKNKVRVGDDVRIIGVRGKVVMIDSTSMILQTPERAIVIPLSKLTTEKVEIFYPDAQEENLLETGK